MHVKFFFYFICCSVILKSLRFFSHTIRDYFFHPFEHQAWNNFFHCAIAFLTQPALQLDTFSQNKRARIVGRYKDMRRETGFEIRSMWFNLGKYRSSLCSLLLHYCVFSLLFNFKGQKSLTSMIYCLLSFFPSLSLYQFCYAERLSYFKVAYS